MTVPATMQRELRRAIESAAALLAEAGIDSARWDADELAAHVAGTERGRLYLIDAPGDDFYGRYREVIEARSRRVPLQHLIGTVSFGPVALQVGLVTDGTMFFEKLRRTHGQQPIVEQFFAMQLWPVAGAEAQGCPNSGRSRRGPCRGSR